MRMLVIPHPAEIVVTVTRAVDEEAGVLRYLIS